MENAENVRKSGLGRRQVLGLGAAALAIAALASLPLRLLPSRRSATLDGIPGEGSIFQPRPRALQEFLRRTGN